MRGKQGQQLGLFDVAPREQCQKYDVCCAPLCPMDRRSLKTAVWQHDEEVCSSPNFAHLPWVQRQKRLVRTAGDDECFTYTMLQPPGKSAAASQLKGDKSPDAKQGALRPVKARRSGNAGPAGKPNTRNIRQRQKPARPMPMEKAPASKKATGPARRTS